MIFAWLDLVKSWLDLVPRCMFFSLLYIYIFFLLFINVFSFLDGLEAIGSFIAFYQARSAQKVFQEL